MKLKVEICLMAAVLFAALLTVGPAFAGFPPQGDAPQTVRVGGDVKPPVKTKDAKPVYPPFAVEHRIQGVVIIEATIGTDGKVKDTKVIRAVDTLTIAALSAVKAMEFKPTVIDGKPVQVIMTIPMNFVL